MAEEKTLSFKIDITGVSNEASELAKLEFQLGNLRKEKAELMKQSKAEGFLSNENKAKLAAYTKEIETQNTSYKNLKKVVGSAEDSLNRMRAELIRMKQEAHAGSAELNAQMTPAIEKLTAKISSLEQAQGTWTRNVGNYAGSFRQMTGAIGGTTGAVGEATVAVGEATESFGTAAGPAGILTAAITLMANAWKNANENVKLYLESADKLKYGGSGFNVDAGGAMDDTVKRARGGITQGRRLEADAKDRLLLMKNLTEEQIKQLQLQIEEGQQMQKDNQLLLDSTGKNKDIGISLQKQLDWKIKYRNLLKEEEILNDEKLAKETEWELLEAELTKQRAIVSNMESTTTEKKEAAVKADEISLKLASDKTVFVNKQLDNVIAISNMTGKQEVVEDKVNGLLKERNTIQKEFYADQIKINRLNKTVDKAESAGALKVVTPEVVDKVEEYKLLVDETAQWELDKINESTDRELRSWVIKNQKEEEYTEKLKQEAENRQRIREQEEEAKMRIASSAADILNAIAGKNKALLMASLIADKALAIAEVIIQTQKANAAVRAWGALGGPIGMVLAEAAVIKNRIAAAASIASIGVAAGVGIAGIGSAKYAIGGKITAGVPINTGTVDDTLIAVNKTETVLTQKHVARLGGSGVMRRIGVPGYADGGYIGQQSPVIPSMGFDYQAMARLMNSIEVKLDINKVNSAQREIQVITETQRI